MKQALARFFAQEQIELYGVLPFAVCRITNRELLHTQIPQPKSLIIYAAPYYVGDNPDANISLYARSKDYHIYLKGLNARLIACLRERFPDSRFAGYGDHSPIDERAAAAAAGLGVKGDNRLLITKKYGSFVFLGEIFTDLPPEVLGAGQVQEIEECLHCGACKAVCPCHFTDCASFFSQKKGELTPEEAEAVKKTGLVWGCDLCQTCCPLNKNLKKSPIPFFYEQRVEHLTAEMLEGMGKKEFRARAFAWHGKAPLRRNLEVLDGEKK